MRIVIAPDSFKGSLSALQAAEAMAAGVRRAMPNVDICSCPLADGGEGSLQAIQAARGGHLQYHRVSDLTGLPRNVAVLLLDNTIVIESAQLVGLSLAADSAVERRTTRGLGELILAGLNAGVRRFLIGLGGTGSNDGGVGMLAALGLRLLDGSGEPLLPLLADLGRLQRIDVAALDRRLADAEIVVLSDVSAPLNGPTGATAVYGPQKGVAPQQLADFDLRLARWASLADAWAGRPLSLQAGAGAAGGLGYALSLLGGQLVPGGRYIAELHDLAGKIAGADWVLTGEGRSDSQTLAGKLPLVVADLAAGSQVPVSLLSGSIERRALPQLNSRFAGCFGVPLEPITEAACMANAGAWLEDMAEQLTRLRWPVELERMQN